jgi:hypothetical protein
MARAVCSVLAAAACLLATASSSAADFSLHQQVQWPWLIDQGARYLASHTTTETRLAPPPTLHLGAPLFGGHVGLGLLVVDCASTTSLVGDDARSAVDFVNVRRSSRMVMERWTLGGGRIQPFAQVGLGQWRKDTERRVDGDVWYGTIYGAGLQVRASSAVTFALEADQAHVRQGGFDVRGDLRGIRAAFAGLRIAMP